MPFSIVQRSQCVRCRDTVRSRVETRLPELFERVVDDHLKQGVLGFVVVEKCPVADLRVLGEVAHGDIFVRLVGHEIDERAL